MVETYGSDEQRVYYVDETVFGTCPATPAMLSLPAESIDPGFDPGNINLRGAGSFDLYSIKKGVRKPTLSLAYVLPSDAPINLLQYLKQDLDKSLSVQVLYWKGLFATATSILSLIYTGTRISKVSVSCAIEDVIKATMDLDAQDLTAGTTKISGATYADYAGAVAFWETYVKKGVATLSTVTNWKFDVNNNPRRVPVIRSTDGQLAKYIPWGKREISGEIDFEFEDQAQMIEALGDTEFALEFGLGGTCKATLAACKWTKITHKNWLDDLISVKALYDCKGPISIAAS
jgi:hypothetical protein